MINPAVRNENIKKLRELIGDIKVAMLTTYDPDEQRMHARPMATQRKPFDGTLWFFTKLKAEKVEEIQELPHVVVSYVDEARNLYISASGTATVERNLQLMEEWWHNGLNSWFPDGLDDPQLGIIRIDVEHAEYWDGPDNAVERLMDFVRAAASREPYLATENEELNLS
jgi:general stress protein 26